MKSGGLDNCRKKRILAMLCAVLIAGAQCLLLWPAFAQESFAETPGDVFSVRVQYFGERGDMIREKARFTRADLEAMGAREWYYSNVTRVGTVMSMAAYGPEVISIIEAAGIDPGSISNITFRTTDGYTRNFTVEKHLSGGRYYYPDLSAFYETNDDGQTLTPLEGALAGGYEVPSILALTFGATKMPGAAAETLPQDTKDTYRFCMGQTPLAEGRKTRPGEGGDVSSMDSVHSIYGMDVTLKGSPVSGIGIDPARSDLKVGSVTKLTIRVEGDELFAEDYSNALGKLIWTSSDPSIAKVDQEGNVTILHEGTAVITVEAENGMSASVTINAGAEEKEAGEEGGSVRAEKDPSGDRSGTSGPAAPQNGSAARGNNAPVTSSSSSAATRATTPATSAPAARSRVQLRELRLGDEVSPEPKDPASQRAADEDTSILEEQDSYAPGTAAGAASVAIAACGVGGIHRYRRFRLIRKGWKH